MSIFNARRLSFINKAEKKNAGNSDEKGHLISWKFNKSSLADGVWKTKGLLSRDGQGG